MLGTLGRTGGCVWGVVTIQDCCLAVDRRPLDLTAPCVLHTFTPVHTRMLVHAKLDRVPQTEGTGLCWPGSSCFCTSRLKTCLFGVLGRQHLSSGFDFSPSPGLLNLHGQEAQ